MPVPFRAKSETHRQFQNQGKEGLPEFYHPPGNKANDVKAYTCEPAIQQKKKPAENDVAAGDAFVAMEPPLQRKKRVQSADRAQGPIGHQADKEYMLLGNQSRFAQGVVYKSKSYDFPKSREVKEDGDPPPASPPPAPRPNPPPNVVFDTGAPSAAAEQKPPVEKKSVSVGPGNGRAKKSSPAKPKSPKAKPVAPPSGKKRDPSPSKHPVPELSHHEPQKRRDVSALPKSALKKPGPKDARERRTGKMDEFAQTNLDKGVADSGQEAPADYAMKYKAGIPPPRPRGPKRVSEYQIQYAWKRPVGVSPLLDAEQLVHKSSTQLAPGASQAVVPSRSEYQLQYQSWPAPKAPPPATNDAATAAPAAPAAQPKEVERKKKTKLRRSKSVGALSPDKMPAAGVERQVSDADHRLLAESLNPLRPYFPHGKQKTYKSEYSANFRSPREFAYEGGAWRGAPAPHIQPEKEAEPVAVESHPPSQGTTPVAPSPSWFDEVQELRDRAQEYKRRARGMHFSREHLAQLLAKQTELWDTASTSSVLSALSLESGSSQRPARDSSREDTGQARPKRTAPAPKRAWHDVTSSEYSSGNATPLPPNSMSSRASVQSAGSSSTLVSEGPPRDPGPRPPAGAHERAPTAKRAAPPGVRHHLDRTTPNTGGAMLGTPPSQKGPFTAARPQESESTLEDYSTSDDNGAEELRAGHGVAPKKSSSAPAVGRSSAQAARSAESLPTFGLPTPDGHALVDEDASTDRPLHTKYVGSPPQNKQGRRDARERFNVAVPSTISEERTAALLGSLSTKPRESPYHVGLDDIPPRPALEDDLLSLSNRSIASSCSMASEVLERARQRRDEFWSNPQGVNRV